MKSQSFLSVSPYEDETLRIVTYRKERKKEVQNMINQKAETEEKPGTKEGECCRKGRVARAHCSCHVRAETVC